MIPNHLNTRDEVEELYFCERMGDQECSLSSNGTLSIRILWTSISIIQALSQQWLSYLALIQRLAAQLVARFAGRPKKYVLGYRLY